MRLDKLLANKAYGSRKEVHQLIKDQRVTINGEVARKKDVHVDIESDVIAVDGQIVNTKQHYYVKFHKPKGYVTAVEDTSHPVVMDLLPPEYIKMGVVPVGRLDKDTVGLLLLTNDGELNHRLISPKWKVDKVYYAKIDKKVTEEDISKFKAGITLDDGYLCKEAKLEILNASEDGSEIIVTIQEGKFHQVKRMFEAVGKSVIYLKRVEFGTLPLDEDLEEGEYRELTEEELAILKSF